MRVLKKTIWPHQVKIKRDLEDFDPRVEWLEEKIPRERWYVIAPHTFCFKDGKDAMMFTLRWS